jgi:hypothetical protein
MLQMLKHYITFWNSDIDNIHDITRPNIGISISGGCCFTQAIPRSLVSVG